MIGGEWVMKIIKISKQYESAFLPFFSEFPGTEESTIRLGALSDKNEVAGILAATGLEFSAHITALYVLPDFRRKGYGKALLDEFVFQAHLKGTEAFQADFLYSDDAAGFFANEGFDLFYTGEQYYLTWGDLRKSRVYKRYLKDGKIKSVVPISSLPPRVWEHLYKEAADTGYDPDYSFVSIKDGKLTSCLFALLDGKDLSITMLAVYSANHTLLLYQLRQLVRRLEEQHPGEDDIRVRMCFEDLDLANDVIRFLGGKGHVRSEGKLVSAIRLD